MRPANATLTAALDRCLPQTQCTRCGYPCCHDYAEAMAEGRAAGNRCPPGGAHTIRMLSAVLEAAPRPLDPEVGPHTPRTYALIDEQRCIGCALCIPACPVDAIVGAAKRMHTVIRDHCTGCELCLAPCPMDCITMLPAPLPAPGDHPWPHYTGDEAARFRDLKRRRDRRRGQRDTVNGSTSVNDATSVSGATSANGATVKSVPQSTEAIHDQIRAAVARTRARRAARQAARGGAR